MRFNQFTISSLMGAIVFVALVLGNFKIHYQIVFDPKIRGHSKVIFSSVAMLASAAIGAFGGAIRKGRKGAELGVFVGFVMSVAIFFLVWLIAFRAMGAG